MRRDLKKTATYRHPIDRVWQALTDREALAAWLMPNDFAPVLGHEFTYRTEPRPGFDGIVHCKITELDPPRRLAYHWRGGPLDTMLTFTLEPFEGGTRLVVEHTGFEGLRAIMVSAILDAGWGKMYKQRLPAVLDRLASGEPPEVPVEPPKPSLRRRVKHRVEHVYAKLIARLP
jgi:uncharacterized protein YndB with AHSA1/START domain